MYTPPDFEIKDFARVRRFIEENSFAILLSSDEGGIQDTHIPLILSSDDRYLIGHIARANAQWKGWEHSPTVKVIFHGPHAYVSPRYYQSEGNVPTWNYTAVSIDGKVEILDSLDEQKAALHALVAAQESSFSDPWTLDESNEGMMRLFGAIVFFRIRIGSWEAKFKLNQNKGQEDQQSVIESLKKSGNQADLDVALLMEEMLKS